MGFGWLPAGEEGAWTADAGLWPRLGLAGGHVRFVLVSKVLPGVSLDAKGRTQRRVGKVGVSEGAAGPVYLKATEL